MKAMDKAELEARVQQLVRGVVNGPYREDARVEFKTEWPADHYRAARRIAALANASGVDNVLWIIGVDDKARSVVPARPEDMATWWPQVERQFEGMKPPTYDLHVITEWGSVVALLFDATRVPYVVRVPSGGAIESEVPWRDGTRTRTARRDELLQILVEKASAPDVDP